jgi:hypothetical protein
MRSRRAGVLAVAALAAAQAACLVSITHVADPTRAFDRARDEAVRLSGRDGRVHRLNVLAWDPSDHEMVRVSVPLWLVHKVQHDVDLGDIDVGDGHDHEHWRRHMNRLRWEDIERAGPGILMEVMEDEGDRVLVWLR